MHTLLCRELHSIGDEVVLHRGIHLYDVASLSPDIQVEDLTVLGLSRKSISGSQEHDVAPVLEGSAKLGSVDGQTERLVSRGADVDIGVLCDRRASSCEAAGGREEVKERD